MKKETPKNGTHKRYFAHNRESDTPFYGSTEVEENYKNGVLHGKVTETVDLRPMGRYTNSGRMQYGAGDVAYECHYKNGVKDGIEVYWHTGMLAARRYKRRELTYKNGLLDGKTTHWGHPTANVKESETNYKNNLLHGKSITWFFNCEKESESNYKNGKKDGKYIVWYYNKQKRSEEVFKNDVMQGKPKYWYPNGKEKDEHIVKLELEEIERGYDMEDMISGETYAEYEKNYEGYDKFGDGTIEADPQYDVFDDLGLTDDERSLGRDFWNKIL